MMEKSLTAVMKGIFLNERILLSVMTTVILLGFIFMMYSAYKVVAEQVMLLI